MLVTFTRLGLNGRAESASDHPGVSRTLSLLPSTGLRGTQAAVGAAAVEAAEAWSEGLTLYMKLKL